MLALIMFGALIGLVALLVHSGITEMREATKPPPRPFDPGPAPEVHTIAVPMWSQWMRCLSCNQTLDAHEMGKCLFGPGQWNPAPRRVHALSGGPR